MNNRTDPFNRRISLEEQRLYDHLISCVNVESPVQLIDRFQSLFIEGAGYPDQEIGAAVERMVASKQAEQEFKFVLNRCCHILINRWQMQSQMQGAIPDLVALFESPASETRSMYFRSRERRRMQDLVKQFTGSEQYITLRRLSEVVRLGPETNANTESRPLGSLIRRYPYLYTHCLLSDDSTYEHQQTVRKIQAQKQRQFEINLSQYVTYQVRKAQVARRGTPAQAGRIIQPMENPTLLSDRELYHALKQYVGKVEGGRSYRDVAQSFITHTTQTQTYKAFKSDLYEYLGSSLDSDYAKRQFNARLSKQLQNTLPQSDSQKLSDFLMVRTCSQLLNFLVVESPQQPNHFVFIDLISNIGPIRTTGLLLKIVLLCRKVKPYLEKRFSILFNHYESSTNDAVQWLIKVLENVNVALSTHFGAVDLSLISQIA